MVEVLEEPVPVYPASVEDEGVLARSAGGGAVVYGAQPVGGVYKAQGAPPW